MSHMTLDGSLKEAHRHLVRAMTDAYDLGNHDLAGEIEKIRASVLRLRESRQTAHPNAAIAGSLTNRLP